MSRKGTSSTENPTMAEKEEGVIEVRSLSGESTTVSISSSKTVKDLKLLLMQCFSPAAKSPNFHLFLKGVKLSLPSRIENHLINSGDFLVLVPFTKKTKVRDNEGDTSMSTTQARNESATSIVAESTYSDMMRELSYLRNASSNVNQPNSLPYGRDNQMQPFSGNQRLLDKLISGMLQSVDMDIFSNETCGSLVKILDSVRCLSNTQSGNCMLSRAANLRGSDSPLLSCICPPWLKMNMKAFTFLNVVSGLLQRQRKRLMIDYVTKILDKLGEFGVPLGIEDIKNLPILCPKVVSFVNDEAVSQNSDDVLLVITLSSEQEQMVKGNLRTGILVSKCIRAMKKRETLFKTTLLDAFERYMSIRKCAYEKEVSLEDILLSMKDANKLVSANKAERAVRSSKAPLLQTRCHFPFHDKDELLLYFFECMRVERCLKKEHRYFNGSFFWNKVCQLPIAIPCSLSDEVDHGANLPIVQETCPLSPMEMAEHIRKGIGSQGQIVHVEEIGARAAALTEIPSELSEKAQSALESLGISKLYSHQAESVRASLAGKNVVLSTMTSSGKSLCYNLPVLEKLSQDMLSCALYLFPTKALAQDQLRSLLTMTGGIGTDLNIGIYDGDTSQTDRISLRDNTRLLITNPDMLHMSILPCHAQFKRILSNLRFVIIDEAHCYKGAFGCHTALILRRLRRLCSHVYGSDPSFIFCTATSANPKEHAMELANLQTLELIQKDGSPSGPKLFLLWNPPLCFKNVPKKAANGKNPIFNSMMKRSSPIVEVACLFAEMVQHGLRCIGFCKTRKLCELVLSYTREILQDSAPHLVNSVCAYRAGYVAEDRRKIERDFFGGKIHGIAATNALELGIDVGLVDVTLHLGFPGSIASMWQQAGRSGRRGRPSLAVYVAFEGPLDQYFMNFPHKLFASPIECCHIDTQNRQLLEQHLICAALEHPLSLIYDETYFGPSLSGAIKALENKGYLSFDPSRASSTRIWSYIGHEKMPSRSISIRSIDSEKFKVIDELKDKVIEEIEESRAFFQVNGKYIKLVYMLGSPRSKIAYHIIGSLIHGLDAIVYEGAVYMNQGRSYLVTKIDLSSKVAYAKEADLKYYTKSRDYTDIHVVGGDIAYPASASSSRSSRTTAQAHCCKVTTIWFGFYRIWKGSNQVFDTVELSLPEYSYESQAVWIRVPQQVKMAVEIDERLQFRAGLHAASHAVLNVVPFFIICNSSDLAPECANPRDGRYFPERILLYDQHPGGNGLSRQIRLVFTEILTAALELLTLCCCIGESGCPDCVQSLACHENNEVLHKDVAIMIIKGVLEAETASVGFPCPFEAA